MRPIAHIRKLVLGITQASMAAIAGTTQATVSRWEAGECEPDREHMERIRSYAAKVGMGWDDRWFFEAPASPAVTEAA